MTAASLDIPMEQGGACHIGFTWHAPGPLVSGVRTVGAANDLTGWEFWLQARETTESPLLIDASTMNGKITVGANPDDPTAPLDPTNGRIDIDIPGTDTGSLPRTAVQYLLQGLDPDGNPHWLWRGTITVQAWTPVGGWV